MAFNVYILRCNDGSHYTGHTDDIETRLASHTSGEIGGYTSTRRPVTLVFMDEFPTRYEALERERQIKGWSRACPPPEPRPGGLLGSGCLLSAPFDELRTNGIEGDGGAAPKGIRSARGTRLTGARLDANRQVKRGMLRHLSMTDPWG